MDHNQKPNDTASTAESHNKLSKKTIFVTIVIGLIIGLGLVTILEATCITDVLKDWPLSTQIIAEEYATSPSETSIHIDSKIISKNTHEEPPIPTPIPSHSIDEAELNQQIDDFLKKEGAYTEENVENMVFAYSPYSKGKLGVIQNAGEYVDAEAVLIDYFQNGSSLILICGFHDKGGDRSVTPVEILVSYYDELPNYNMFVLCSLEKPAPNYDYHSIIDDNFSTPVANQYLEPLKEHCIILSFETGGFFNSFSDSIGSINVADRALLKNYISMVAEKENLSKKLVSELYANENKIRYSDIPKDITIIKIIGVTHADESFEIENALLPVAIGMEYLVDYMSD